MKKIKTFFQNQLNILNSDEDNLINHIIKVRSLNNNFFEFKYKDYWPNDLPGLESCITSAMKAIINKKKCAIVGDYDVDGITATALFKRFFNHLNIDLETIIPNRFINGYGITPSLIKEIDADVIFTVDNGTTAYEAIDYIQSIGKTLIIIDHHDVVKELPIETFLNPKRTENIWNNLCAAGLSFVFLCELKKNLKKEKYIPEIVADFSFDYVDIVALGTVCDIMSLTYLNRVFVYHGLNKLKNDAIAGLKVFQIENPNTNSFGFIIGPHINATGRFGHAEIALKLLTTNDYEEAKVLLNNMKIMNDERRNIEKKIVKEAIQNAKGNRIIYSIGKWHEGVIGIVASRLKDEFKLPAMVITNKDGIYKASIRSACDFRAGQFIKDGIKCGAIKFGGGHDGAGGFVMEENQLNLFEEFIFNYDFSPQLPKLKIDGVISIFCLTQCKWIQKLEPCGAGNNSAVFLIPNCQIYNFQFIKNHLSLILMNESTNKLKVIMFDVLNKPTEIITKQSIIHAIIQVNTYMNNASFQLIDFIIPSDDLQEIQVLLK